MPRFCPLSQFLVSQHGPSLARERSAASVAWPQPGLTHITTASDWSATSILASDWSLSTHWVSSDLTDITLEDKSRSSSYFSLASSPRSILQMRKPFNLINQLCLVWVSFSRQYLDAGDSDNELTISLFSVPSKPQRKLIRSFIKLTFLSPRIVLAKQVSKTNKTWQYLR